MVQSLNLKRDSYTVEASHKTLKINRNTVREK